MSRRDWYPALPEIHKVGSTLKAVGFDPASGKKSVANVHMLGLGKNPGSVPAGPNNNGTSITDSILEPDPSTFSNQVGDVFWLERDYLSGNSVRRRVVYRGNARKLSDPKLHTESVREHAAYGNDDGPRTFDRCTFIAIAGQSIQRCTANTKAKQDAATGKWYAERVKEVVGNANYAAGHLDVYFDMLTKTGTHTVDQCVAVECGLAIGAGRASYGYSFFPAPFDVHIRGGSYTTTNAPGHDSSDSSPDLDVNSFGGLLVEGKTWYVDVDPETGRGRGGPNNDGVMQFDRSVFVEDWQLELTRPDRSVVFLRNLVAPVEMFFSRCFGGKIALDHCTGGINVRAEEGDTRIVVDGVDVGRIDKGYSRASS